MNEDGIPNVFNTKLKKKNNAQLGDWDQDWNKM
jgi:hypothetical protein